jgi:DNA-binding XRE family transcriptional regulator
MRFGARSEDGRWNSKFGRFVSRFGAEKLADEVGVSRHAVYHWLRGENSPRASLALQIQTVARTNGFSISLDDVYANFRDSFGASRRRVTSRR